jgi:signal transduction histidine kinase
MSLLRLCILFVALFVSTHSVAQTGSKPSAGKQGAEVIRELADKGKTLVYQFPDSSIRYFSRAVKLADSLGLTKETADNTSWLGVAYYVMGEYNFALPFFNDALHLFEQTGDQYGLATSYNHLGLISQTQRQYQKAIAYHKKGVLHAQAINDLDRQATNNFNIGLAYDELQNYDSAMYYLTLSHDQSDNGVQHRVFAMGLNRMAKVNYHLGNLDKAEILYDSALRYKDYQSNWEKSFTWAGLSEVYGAQGRHADGIEIGLKSLALAKEIKAKWDVVHAAEILSKLYANNRMFEQAYKMSSVAQAYKDSVFSEEKENQLNYIQLKENELANANLEKENTLQLVKLRQKDFQVIAAAVVAALCIVIIVVLYSRHRQKLTLNRQLVITNKTIEEQNKDLSEVNQTKSRLISILSHDMRAPFNSLHGLLELLRAGGISEERRQELVEELTENFRSVSGTLDNLLQWTHSQMEGIHANPKTLVASDLIDRNLAFWEASIKKKKLQIHYERKRLPVYADQFQLKTVIRNILGNAIKFTPVGGSIFIDTLNAGDKTCFVIRDTGIGIPENIRASLFKFQRENQRTGTSKEKGTGLGMMISYQLLEKNGGTIEVESEEGEGSSFKISLPATPAPSSL